MKEILFFLNIYILLINILLINSRYPNFYGQKKKVRKAIKNNNNIIHFFKSGESDSILIEGNGQYGLVDASNPYIFKTEKKTKMDKKIQEKNPL